MSEEQRTERQLAELNFQMIQKQGFRSGDSVYADAFNRLMLARRTINVQQLGSATQSAESAFRDAVAATAAGVPSNPAGVEASEAAGEAVQEPKVVSVINPIEDEIKRWDIPPEMIAAELEPEEISPQKASLLKFGAVGIAIAKITGVF